MAHTSIAKTTFYPMAGSVLEQFNNLLQTLHWLDLNKPTPDDVYRWLLTTYGLSHHFARNVYTVILISGGLVSVRYGRCYLTRDGRAVLDADSPALLLNIFEKQFVGVAAVLEVLRVCSSLDIRALQTKWFETIKARFPKVKDWSVNTISSQCKHRVNWLRAMEFITSAGGRYSLSESGWQFVITHPPEAIAIQRHEIKKEEKHLHETVLGEFEPFDESAEKVQFLRSAFARSKAFRNIVTAQYDRRCAICAFRLKAPRGVYEAEAAHIIPRRMRGSDDPRNGLSLCGSHHWAFDEGVISIRAKDLTIMAASYLEELSSDESAQRILRFKGKPILTVMNPQYTPSVVSLDWHNQRIYLG